MGSCCSKASSNNADLELTDINNESPSSRRKQTSHSTNKRESTAKEIQDDIQSEAFMQQVASFKEILNGKGPSQLHHQLKSNLDSWKHNKLNIAVIGESGSGKSSLINAILDLTADDKGSAPVGVTETTIKIVYYMNRKHPNLIFWDFPGVGTPKYPKEEYFYQLKRESGKELSDFDFFLIVSNNRFRENDLWFANEIQKQKKQFYFCRTHIDDCVSNDKKAHPKSHNEQEVLQKMKTDIIFQLSKNGITTKIQVFLIDNYQKKTYDFETLMSTLIKDVPAIKKNTLILSLSSDLKTIIDEKVNILKERIYKVAVLACAGNIIPIPGAGIGVEATVMFREANFYREQLGIDDNSIKKICSNMNMEENFLQQNVDFKTHTILSTTKEFLKFLSIHAASDTVESIAKFALPIIGSIISAAVSYPMCIISLRNILEMCESEARKTNEVITDWLNRKTKIH